MRAGGAHVSNNFYYSRSWTSKLRDEELFLEFSRMVVGLAYYCAPIFPDHAQTEKTNDRLPIQWRLHLTLPLNLRPSSIWQEITFRARSGDSI